MTTQASNFKAIANERLETTSGGFRVLLTPPAGDEGLSLRMRMRRRGMINRGIINDGARSVDTHSSSISVNKAGVVGLRGQRVE